MAPPQPKPNPTGQSHENDRAATVLVCAPSALSKMMGSLHPAGALYERPVNLRSAREAHDAFVDLLRRRGVDVRDVRDILTDRVAWSLGDRVELENLAFNCLRYEFADPKTTAVVIAADEHLEPTAENGHSCEKNRTGTNAMTTDHSASSGSLSDEQVYSISDRYKRAVIEAMGEQQLVDIIFTNPTVTVSPSPRDTGFVASYRFDPLSNIIFVRDQQITTRRGIVMARLRSPQRAREVDIMRFCFNKLGLKVVGAVPPPGHLEGGDFFPLGPELALLGIGPRSDWAAARFLLENDLFGTAAVAIVRDDLEQKQERMHLDTVFNILSDDCCVMLEDMMGEGSPTKRVVDEYVLHDSPRGTVAAGAADGYPNGTHVEDGAEGKRQVEQKVPGDEACSPKSVGNYVLARRGVEFSTFMKEKGFNVIPVSGKEQLKYGCNVLNIGKNHVVAIEKNVARQIACSPLFKGTVEYLNFEGVTCMYGGVHCASQVVFRRTEGSGEVADFSTVECDRMSNVDGATNVMHQ